MYRLSYHTLYWCDYLFLVGLKLIHVNNRGPGYFSCIWKSIKSQRVYQDEYDTCSSAISTNTKLTMIMYPWMGYLEVQWYLYPLNISVRHDRPLAHHSEDSSGLGDSARAPKKLRVSNPFFYIFWNFYLYSFWTPLFMKIPGKRRNYHPGFYPNGFCLMFEDYEHHLKPHGPMLVL